MKPWKQYQLDVAHFFSRLGYKAEVEKKVKGIRGEHEVDVYVTGHHLGIDFVWVIECKYWNSTIPKEKTLVLIEIVNDIGADKGFLVSESGFQPGTIRSSRSTNIVLTSLSDLKENSIDILIESEYNELMMRKISLEKKLRHGINDGNEFNPKAKQWQFMMKMFAYDMALDKALAGDYPVCYEINSDSTRKYANSWDDLTEKMRTTYNDAEEYCRKSKLI